MSMVCVCMKFKLEKEIESIFSRQQFNTIFPLSLSRLGNFCFLQK